MGHDITGYKGKVEVAYMFRGATSELNKIIYEVLDSTDLYGECSGEGTRKFNKEQLSAALSEIEKYYPDCDREIDFLKDCIKACDSKSSKIKIEFY